jgi:outer membrane protein
VSNRSILSPLFGKGLILVAACCALPAVADAPALPDHLVGNLGAGVYASSSARNLPHEAPLPFPFIYADLGRLYARVDTFGIRTLPLGDGYLELAGRVSVEGWASGVAGRHRLPGRANPIPLGVGTFQETPIGGFFLYAFQDLRSHGSLFEATYAAQLSAGALGFYPQLGIARRSARFEQRLRGVNAQQALASQLPAYAAGASVTPMAALAADLPLSGPWQLNLEWRRDWYDRRIRNSPLNGSRRQDSGFVALSYGFK